MTTTKSAFDSAYEQVERLTYNDKLRLIGLLIEDMREKSDDKAPDASAAFMDANEKTGRPRRSLRGLWAGINISDEDIAVARREMWGNFPREDI